MAGHRDRHLGEGSERAQVDCGRVTVLVTGAAGFVGSQVVRQLVASGIDVAAMVRPGSARPRLRGLEGKVQLLEADVADTEAIATWLAKYRPDSCIHAAWYAEPGKYLDSPLNLDSLRSSLALLENLAKAGCKHDVRGWTCFEYETGSTPLDEDSPTRPLTPYAAAQLAFPQGAAPPAKHIDIGLAVARLCYLYRP